jgi:hypothetical protein
MAGGASSTDVRAWAREQGHQVPARGAVPTELRDLYNEAHPPVVVPGTVTESSFDPSMGVTEADFPPDDDYPDPDAGAPGKPAEPKAGASRERKPRAVKPPPGQGGWRGRLFGSQAKPKAAAKSKAARISLSDFAEETWADLAFLAQPIPPLARILDIQAPYAGVVFDDQVKGTIADALLQPVAQYSGMFRALNGLVGPPVYVGMICATGARVQLTGPDGKGIVDQDGQPVTDFDGRTKMLFQGLRYSLLQMTKITEVNADAIMARRIASDERMKAVEVMIATIFQQPMPTFVPAATSAPPPGGGGGDPPSPSSNGYRYPGAPTMDGAGADPGRI